ATSPTARFRFTDVPPGDYTVSIETLDRRLPDPKVYCRDVSVPARDFQTLHFPLPGNRADTLAWSIVTPAGVALERAPIALQSPNWPMPLLYDVPLARPVLRWDRSLPLSWCVRVPGCQPSWGDRNSWPQETTRL